LYVFALGAALIAPYLLWSLTPRRRSGFVLRILGAAALAIAISLPVLSDQIAAMGARVDGSPIVIAPVAVLGPFFDPVVRRLLDVPAFWLVLLPVEFAAFYLAGLIGLFALLKDGDGKPCGSQAFWQRRASWRDGFCAASWPTTTTWAGARSCPPVKLAAKAKPLEV